ncbi:hypothetical protein AUJ65_05070 [Candidatus Micrarchaeota archaeon CG1_02_51_15]|nr:MAG: hypothetical protein AUJ65_05070 [Candidatus Micrarchaeota archaeon CG1_02_51_15]
MKKDRVDAACFVLEQLSNEAMPSFKKLSSLKLEASEQFGLPDMISNSELIAAASAAQRKRLSALLRKAPVRSLSGVSVIAIMAKPSGCVGKCIYCPGGTKSPKSYTGQEPAARRAEQMHFDAFKQVRHRVTQLKEIGHNPRKCELIVMGGTFNALPLGYQRNFVKRAFDGFNVALSTSLAQAQKKNEHASRRVVGITFETRPDYATPERISRLVDFGATRIELGVQTLSDQVYKKVRRGHCVQDVVDATQTCKNAFLKVCYHYMPGLFCTPEEDVRMMRQLFEDPRFKPDLLKIYPCLVLKGTPLYRMWKRGEFTPYSTEEAAEVIAEAKRFFPPWVRVMRVDRDIPVNLVEAGVDKSNLREIVAKKLAEKGGRCRCIRCREAGLQARTGKAVDWKQVELKRVDYDASNGKEVFLSFEDSSNDLLLGFLRLRTPSENPFRKELEGCAGVRELHVYGEQLAIGTHDALAVQHKDLGKRLLIEAERIAFEEWHARRVAVISGVGVRDYYRKQGYRLDGAYVAKKL